MIRHELFFPHRRNKPTEMTLRAVQPFQPSQRDLALESELERLIKRYNASESREMKKALWRKIAELHKQRSPQMIAMQEAQKGLR